MNKRLQNKILFALLVFTVPFICAMQLPVALNKDAITIHYVIKND